MTSKTKILVILLAVAMAGGTFTSCNKQVCAAYSNNVDGNVKKKKHKKKRRRQEGMDKKIYGSW